MVPKKSGGGANLLVPVCLSASAVAYSSTRIENMFMSVGSAAGVAAKQVKEVGTLPVNAFPIVSHTNTFESIGLRRVARLEAEQPTILKRSCRNSQWGPRHGGRGDG